MSDRPTFTIASGAGEAVPPARAARKRDGRVHVWDLPVRIFHWSLVVLVLSAWLTGGTGLRIHEAGGYVVTALMLFRLGWGFTGTRHARFSDFVRSPAQVLRYLADLAAGRSKRHLGHNPAGGAMVVALLVLISIICTTGVMQTSNRFFGVAWVENLHWLAANTLMLLVPLHLLGVLVSSLVHRENLVVAMVTGNKLASPHDVEPALAPGPRRRLRDRVHALQGCIVLLLLLFTGAFYGWSSTVKVVTVVAQAPPQAVAARPTVTVLAAKPTALAPADAASSEIASIDVNDKAALDRDAEAQSNEVASAGAGPDDESFEVAGLAAAEPAEVDPGDGASEPPAATDVSDAPAAPRELVAVLSGEPGEQAQAAPTDQANAPRVQDNEAVTIAYADDPEPATIEAAKKLRSVRASGTAARTSGKRAGIGSTPKAARSASGRRVSAATEATPIRQQKRVRKIATSRKAIAALSPPRKVKSERGAEQRKKQVNAAAAKPRRSRRRAPPSALAFATSSDRKATSGKLGNRGKGSSGKGGSGKGGSSGSGGNSGSGGGGSSGSGGGGDGD